MKLDRNLLLILLCSVLVAGVPVLVFQDVLSYEFLNYDDDIYVTGNPVVQSLHYRHIWTMFTEGYFRSYQPMTLLSHAFDYALWGEKARGHHLTSLLLHAGNSLMLMTLSLLLLRRLWSGHASGDTGPESMPWWVPIAASATAALLFAVHPLRVESVAWISDRKDLVMTFFLIPSCIAYLLARTGRHERKSALWYWASVALFTCGVLAKTVAVALPVALLCLDLMLMPRGRWRMEFPGLLRLKIPYLLLALALGTVAILVGGGHTMSRLVRDLSPLEQVLVPAYSMGIYLLRTVIPLGLTPVYSAPELVVLAGMTLAVAVLSGWVIRNRRHPAGRACLLAAAAFALFILPTMVGIFAKTGIQPWADRYVYFSSVPLFLLLGGALAGFLRRGTSPRLRLGVAATAVGAALVLNSVLARAYMPVWQSSEPLWQSVIRSSPDLSFGYNNLGTVLLGRGELREALTYYRTAQHRDPAAPGPWYNMGLAYADLGRRDSAAWYYREAIVRDSSFIDGYTALGTLALLQGEVDEARRQYERALVHDPTSAKAHHNIGILDYKQGNASEARRHFECAVASEPFSTRALLSLAVACRESGDGERARQLFRDAARLGSPEAQQLLAAENDTW